MLPPAAVLPIPAGTADLTLLTGPFLLRGWSFGETTGSAAGAANLYDGASASGVLVASVFLLQGTSTTSRGSDAGIIVRTGLFLDMLAGNLSGAVYYTPLTHLANREWALGEWSAEAFRPGA